MHCELHPSIVYTQFSAVIRKQKEIIKELISQRQNGTQNIQPGLTCFKEGVRCIPIEAIPGLREINCRQLGRRVPDPIDECVDPEKLGQTLMQVLVNIRQHSAAWPFLKPVDKNEVPDYYDHIKYPMDLKTIQERLKKGCGRYCIIF